MRGNRIPLQVKPLSSATQHTTDIHAKCTNGLLTLVPLELPTFSSKLHCSFAACTGMEEGVGWGRGGLTNKTRTTTEKETNRKGDKKKKKSMTEL